MVELDGWVENILADPVTKRAAEAGSFPTVNGVLDARVLLRNTPGFAEWQEGQEEYESAAVADSNAVADYQAEKEYDRPVYERFQMGGRILDCGGGAGTVREFLADDVEFVSTDPWLSAPYASSSARKEAYSCLQRPLNFIGATAEFQPFSSEAFDWVHMRSMLDHVQVPDLALLEARRVLKPDGRLLVGLYVEGGRKGRQSVVQLAKGAIKTILGRLGVERWKDHHVWHPTYDKLLKLISDNGFSVEETYWQPHWNDTVCYVSASKT